MNDKILQLEKIFPECVTEKRGDNGELVKAVNFDLLKQILTENFSDAPEAYTFNWVGKTAARVNAYRKIDKTLRPCVAESKNFDTTQNLYIEGDNLDALKLLQQSYLHKVKLIYIDPPYNTGRNFIYKNNFMMNSDKYDEETDLFDDDDNKNFVENTDSNPRFHSDWCSMIYSRLLLARNLLADDGVIFIAIDDNELFNLKKICDEVFGTANFIGTIVTKCNPQGRNKNNIDPVHEYHIVFAKSIIDMPLLKLKKSVAEGYRSLMRSGTNSRKTERPYRFYPILAKKEKVFMIEKNEYEKIYSPNVGFNENFIEELRKKYESAGFKFILPISKDGEEKVWQRTFDRVAAECSNYICKGNKIEIPEEIERTPISLWTEDKYSNVSNGTNYLKTLFSGQTPFSFPKSIYTVQDIISLISDKDAIVLDFFSGSATTAHAVMELNAEDGGKRKFIMVQLPEVCAETSEAYKAGYKNICEIGKERIRRAGEKITADVDTGFRVLKIAETNFKRFKIRPSELTQEDLKKQVENIKDDSTALDLLFERLINCGAAIHYQIESENFEGATILNYNANDLVACFDKKISLEVIKYIAQKKPRRAIFRDACFQGDADKINAEEIFKLYAPNANFKVI